MPPDPRSHPRYVEEVQMTTAPEPACKPEKVKGVQCTCKNGKQVCPNKKPVSPKDIDVVPGTPKAPKKNMDMEEAEMTTAPEPATMPASAAAKPTLKPAMPSKPSMMACVPVERNGVTCPCVNGKIKCPSTKPSMGSQMGMGDKSGGKASVEKEVEKAVKNGPMSGETEYK
ncbi:hypothetical protein MMPV_006287 [Pyropia vietnamensis]